jgi:hypothetical protein
VTEVLPDLHSLLVLGILFQTLWLWAEFNGYWTEVPVPLLAVIATLEW